MSFLKTGFSAPTIQQFATEPITIEEPNVLRFSDSAGVVKETIGVQGATTIFDIENTAFNVKTGATPLLTVDGASGEITVPTGLNGRGLVLGGIMITPSVASTTLSPAQVQSLATAGFSKGIWLINAFTNISLDAPFPGNTVTVSVLKGATLVGESVSHVGSDSGVSYGNYMHVPSGFAIPMNAPLDATQSYTFTISNGELYQIQYIPLY